MSRTPDIIHTVHGLLIRETDKAVLFEVRGIGTGRFKEKFNVWFPLSQITKIHTAPNIEDEDYIMVKEWILVAKDLLSKLDLEQGTEPESSDIPPWVKE